MTKSSEQLRVWTGKRNRLAEMFRCVECFPTCGEQCAQLFMRIRVLRIGPQRRPADLLGCGQPAVPRQQFGETRVRPAHARRDRKGGSQRLLGSLVVSLLDLG